MPKQPTDEEQLLELLEDVAENRPTKLLCPLTFTAKPKKGAPGDYEVIGDKCLMEGCGWFSKKARCCGIRLLGNGA